MQLRKKTYRFEFDAWKTHIRDVPQTDALGTDIRICASSCSPSAIGPVLDSADSPLDFRGKIYIAPLTTVGNLPFRRICVDYGADITCSEMALCGNLLDSQASEWALLRRHPSERCFGIQVATGRLEDAGYVSELLRRELKVDFVDLNAGCPIDAVDKAGAGAGLLMKVGRLKRIVRCMLNSLQNVPLMVKIRTGDHKNTSHRLVPQLQQIRGNRGNRVKGVIIHGRTKQSRYTKTADWELQIAREVMNRYVKSCAQSQLPGLPRLEVIGNGDVFDNEVCALCRSDVQDYWNHLQDGVLDGIMIGRGALIKPWISTEIKERRTRSSEASSTGHWDISASERLEIIRTFCGYGLEHWGSDLQGVDRTRRFLLEWLSFLCRYVPYGLLERPQTIQQRPVAYFGRSDLETLLGSRRAEDWIKISEMFLGPVSEGFSFIPKHRSIAYTENFRFC